MSNILTPSLGVCYYPEQWAPEKWPIDFDQMRDLGIRFVRVAEFAWSRLEPSPGKYRFERLKAVLDLAAERQLSIISEPLTILIPAASERAYMLRLFCR